MKTGQKKFIFTFFISVVYFNIGISQGVNGYAEVSSISGNTINLGTVDESDDTFEDGEYVIIMQMQDDIIGTTSNTVNFGDLGSIQSVGLYEIRQISTHTESVGTPTSLVVEGPLTNTYNIGANTSVQVITFPSFGSPDYTTTGNISATAWDGTIGGIVAFDVPGILTLAHNIDADEAGFLGAPNDISSSCGGSVCENTVYISANNSRARKGEGIYRNTNTSFEAARGRILTGGGGGSCHNGGGGGGGNYTAGGEGGIGWGCQSSSLSAGGLGGLDMSASITSSRFFMGGGGGAGERNNNHNTRGGNGGGIIIIRATEINTSGACGGLSISANGETTPSIGNDGAGGAGAGGSIFLDVPTWNVAASCLLTVSANGGSGGSSLSGGIHGGGGGGGQGVVIYSSVQPLTNITTETIPGTGGCGNTSSPCNSVAGTGTGTNNTGVVVSGGSGPLPIELLDFNVRLVQQNVKVEWETASEVNNDYFTVERSVDHKNWEQIAYVKGAINSSKSIEYEIVDQRPYQGVSYYRLTQTDLDGTFEVFAPKSIEFNYAEENPMKIYPNPASGSFIIETRSIELSQVLMTNVYGQNINCPMHMVNGQVMVDTDHLPDGVYFVNIYRQNQLNQVEKLMVKH